MWFGESVMIINYDICGCFVVVMSGIRKEDEVQKLWVVCCLKSADLKSWAKLKMENNGAGVFSIFEIEGRGPARF